MEEGLTEFLRYLAIAVVFLLFIAFTVYGVWMFADGWRKANQIENLRTSTAEIISKSSGGTGAVNLSLLKPSILPPCTEMEVYYFNGTLAKRISTPC
jgi:hypothetical protein